MTTYSIKPEQTMSYKTVTTYNHTPVVVDLYPRDEVVALDLQMRALALDVSVSDYMRLVSHLECDDAGRERYVIDRDKYMRAISKT